MGELPSKENGDINYWQIGLMQLMKDAREADPETLQIILQLIEKTADHLRKISRERTKGNTYPVRF
jgi:hypothetical protein